MTPHRPQRGFALVSALFLLVVLSLLAAYLVEIVAVQHATPAMRIDSSRAEYAARAGAAWAAQRAVAGNACVSGSFVLASGALQGYRVTVVCSESLHSLGSSTRKSFTIQSLGEYASFGSPDYVSRAMRAKVLGRATVPAP